MKLPPCLVILAIEVGHKTVSADLQIGSRQERLEIELTHGLISHKKMPKALKNAWRVRRVLNDILSRAHDGEAIELPQDLSSVVLDSGDGEPWPGAEDPDDHKSDPPVDVKVVRVEKHASERKVTTVHMEVVGVPTVVVVDNRKQEDEYTLFRFVSGVHPWQISDAEEWAMEMALGRAVKGIRVP